MNVCATGKLVIHKVIMLHDNPQIYTSLHVGADLTWEAKFCGRILRHDSELLCGMPLTVSAATEVGNLLSKLEVATVCTGNEDVQFIVFAASRGGKFFNRASK